MITSMACQSHEFLPLSQVKLTKEERTKLQQFQMADESVYWHFSKKFDLQVKTRAPIHVQYPCNFQIFFCPVRSKNLEEIEWKGLLQS